MILTANALCVTYGRFKALDDVTLSVGPNEILGIAGPNGAGKTTLFDALTGRVRVASGSIFFDGRGVTRASMHARSRAGLVRTFQTPVVPDRMTPREFFTGVAQAYRPELPVSRLEDALELVGFDSPVDRRCSELDTLDRRRLLLAGLLARNPKVVLLDEPCSGLLVDEIRAIEEIVKAIHSSGAAVVVVEHRLELLQSVADRLVVLDYGKTIGEGRPDDVFDLPAVREAYFDTPSLA